VGQQALEGRRVPCMTSGRTLFSFASFDPNPRAYLRSLNNNQRSRSGGLESAWQAEAAEERVEAAEERAVFMI